MSEAFISANALTWARSRLKATDIELAQRVHVKPEKLRTWEVGQSRPTLRQARILADALKVPFAFLFLKNPPAQQLPLPDRRVVALKDHPTPSVDLIDVAHAAKRKQDWYRDYRLLHSFPALSFVGSHSISDDPATVASHMKAVLGLVGDFYLASKSWADHLARLSHAAEKTGILVFRSGIVGTNTHRTLDVSEFRGLAISDLQAPVVFINARDAKSAQVFTIAHELAHIWIGESAATDSAAEGNPASQSSTERFCDRVATEFLVPEQQFILDWPHDKNLGDRIEMLARRYRVSRMMVLRRAFELKKISSNQFYQQMGIERGRSLESRKTGGGGSFEASFAARNGHMLIESIFESVLEGRTLYREAAVILEVGTGTLTRLLSDAALARGA